MLEGDVGVALADRSVQQEVLVAQILLVVRDHLLLHEPALSRRFHVFRAPAILLIELTALLGAASALLAHGHTVLFELGSLEKRLLSRRGVLHADVAEVLCVHALLQEWLLLVRALVAHYGRRVLHVRNPDRSPKCFNSGVVYFCLVSVVHLAL